MIQWVTIWRPKRGRKERKSRNVNVKLLHVAKHEVQYRRHDKQSSKLTQQTQHSISGISIHNAPALLTYTEHSSFVSTSTTPRFWLSLDSKSLNKSSKIYSLVRGAK